MKLTKWLIAGLAIVLVVVLYMSLIGWSVAIDDFDSDYDGDGDPDDIDEDAIIAAGKFEVDTSVWQIYDDGVQIAGNINGIALFLEPFQSFDASQVFERETWNILSPMPPATELGTTWIVIEIDGPSGFSSEWTGERTPVIASTTPQYITYHTGAIYFVDMGQYIVKITLYSALYEYGGPEIESTLTKTYTVDTESIYGG